MKEVTVVNKSPNIFKDSYVGVEYVFAPGQKVNIPMAAAKHIFGYGQKDMNPYYRRIGATDPVKGKMFFDNFELTEVEWIRKDDAVELEALRINIEQKDIQINEMADALAALTTENEQLKAKLEKLEADSDPSPKKKK